MPLCIYAIDKKIDDPVGALSAHGIAGIWGTISCGLFTAPRLAEYNGFGDAGLIYTGSFHQLCVQALGVVTVFAFVFVLSYGTFWAIKKTYGLRVTAEEEDAGLDISEHGMYGYPEQFIPAPELVGYAVPPGGSRDIPREGARPPGGPGNMKKVEAFVRHEAFEPIRDGAPRARLPLALHLGGQGVRPAEGDHRALPRRGADELSPPEGEGRVRGRVG